MDLIGLDKYPTSPKYKDKDLKNDRHVGYTVTRLGKMQKGTE